MTEGTIPLAGSGRRGFTTPFSALTGERGGMAVAWWLAGVLAALTAYRALALAAADLALHFDEAQYWGWSRELAWGYYSKPPVLAAAIRFATSVCGDGEACVRSPSFVGAAIAAWLVFLAVRRLHGARIAAYAAVAFATLPIVSLGAWAATSDGPLILFWCVGLYCFIRALESDAAGWWIGAGVAFGLGLMSKYSMAVFAVSVVAYLLWEPGLRDRLRSWKPWAAALAAFLIFAPNVWWNAAHGFPTFAHTAEISYLERGLFRPGELALFLVGQLAVFGPLLAVALLLAIAAIARGRGDSRTRLWASFALPFLAIVALTGLFGHANLNWAAPACVTGTVLAVAHLCDAGRMRLLVAAIAVNVALGLGLYHLAPNACALGAPAKLDPTVRLEGWRELGDGVRALLAARPGARLVGDNRRVIAEMIYYARPLSAGALAWNPQRTVTDHYRLLADVAGAKDGPFVIVTEGDARDRLARDFVGLRPLGVVEGGGCAGRRRSLHAYSADRFAGYSR